MKFRLCAVISPRLHINVARVYQSNSMYNPIYDCISIAATAQTAVPASTAPKRIKPRSFSAGKWYAWIAVSGKSNLLSIAVLFSVSVSLGFSEIASLSYLEKTLNFQTHRTMIFVSITSIPPINSVLPVFRYNKPIMIPIKRLSEFPGILQELPGYSPLLVRAKYSTDCSDHNMDLGNLAQDKWDN